MGASIVPLAVLQIAGDEREIGLLHGAGGELFRELAMSVVVFRHDQATAGFLVEPMNNAGPFLAANAGER